MTGAISTRAGLTKACVAIFLAGGISIITEQSASAVSKFFVPPAGSPGDYNGNGTVDPPDYGVWRSNFGSTSSLAADGNGNSVIDAADYVVWRDHLGESAAPVGNWENPNYWNPAGLPGQFDGAIIHANRTANVSTDVGFISELRIGDTFNPPGGTVNINAGGKVTTLGEVLMGASNPGFYKEGKLNLNGGTLVSFGAFFIAFEPEATETVNVAPGSLLDVNANLFGRFGIATVNQTGGAVDVQNNLIWGEGGDDGGFTNRSEYNIMAGTLTVGATLSIGRSPGDDRPESNGRINVSGGIVTAGDLLFGNFPGEEAILSISGTGNARINQTNYSIADANADIAGGFIIGSGLNVTTMNVSGTNYTQITSSAGAGTAVATPEPGVTALLALGLGLALLADRRGARPHSRRLRQHNDV